jgi:hypothetical protein
VSSIEGIPSYVLQNMASIQDNINGIIAENIKNGGAKVDFGNFLGSALDDITAPFGDDGFDETTFDSPYQAGGAPGLASNRGNTANAAALVNKQIAPAQNVANPQSAAVVKKAYDSLLNGDMAQQLSPMVASADKNSLAERLKKLASPGALDKNTSLVTDDEFYDAETMTPGQITEVLKKKGSPYANQTFEGGKTIGQLIYDACHEAGTVPQGSHTINPALMLAVMGAESGFGTDPKSVRNNPFNIRLNGSFQNVPNLETSLNMAVNTLYNWSKDRPANSRLSLLDYAGDKYCENYTEKWKPNVEKYFLEISLQSSHDTNQTAVNPEPDQKQKLMTQMLSSLGTGLTGGEGGQGMNIDALLKMATNKDGADNVLANANMLSGMGVSGMNGMKPPVEPESDSFDNPGE